MAYVILTEGLYDQEWTDKWMYGFQPQADYILGKGGKGVGDFDPSYKEYAKIPKTPEWAEGICAVPAETIRELARLYGKTKPAVLHRHYGATRKSYGEYTLKTALFLSVITYNNPGIHGGYGSTRLTVRTIPITLGRLPRADLPGEALEISPGGYSVPTFYRAFHWWKAVEYAVRVRNGGPSIMHPGKKMDWKEWGTLVGFNATQNSSACSTRRCFGEIAATNSSWESTPTHRSGPW
jgi:anaerobic selenocysteine-containing dehydrogenase